LRVCAYARRTRGGRVRAAPVSHGGGAAAGAGAVRPRHSRDHGRWTARGVVWRHRPRARGV
jgi:hypothetical protein